MSSLLWPPNPLRRGTIEKNGDPRGPIGKGMEKADGHREHGASAGTRPRVSDPLERGLCSQVSAQWAQVGRKEPHSLPILTREQGASRKIRGHSKCQLGSHLDREYTSQRQGTWNPTGEARSTQENAVNTGESRIGNKELVGPWAVHRPLNPSCFPLLNPIVLNPAQDAQPTQISILFLSIWLRGECGLSVYWELSVLSPPH